MVAGWVFMLGVLAGLVAAFLEVRRWLPPSGRHRTEPRIKEADALSQAPAPVGEIDLAELSLSELDAWLQSPFWRLLCDWLGHEIDLNKEALVQGDIAVKMKDAEGMVYRSDEALRGGIIGMEFTRSWFPGQIKMEIQVAQQERAEKQDRKGDDHG